MIKISKTVNIATNFLFSSVLSLQFSKISQKIQKRNYLVVGTVFVNFKTLPLLLRFQIIVSSSLVSQCGSISANQGGWPVHVSFILWSKTSSPSAGDINAVFYRTYLLFYHKFGNMVFYRPGNLYSLCSSGN